MASFVVHLQVIGALGGARNAMPLEDALTNVGINGVAAALFAFLISRDLKVGQI
jgi:hypothetical protein